MGMLMEDHVGGDVEEQKKDEAFRKNPFVCEQSVDHYYYLLPRGKRSKLFRRKKPPTVMPQKKGLKVRISLKRKRIEVPDEDLSMERNKTQTLLNEEQSKLEDREKKMRKIKPIIDPPVLPPIIDPPVLPDELMEKISGMGVQISQVKLVIQKALYATDLKRHQARLSIPVKQVVSKDFLTPQQIMVLDTKDNVSNKNSQIQFGLIEPSLEETKIHLAKWDMRSSSNYVLLNDWVQVKERNNLEVGMVVQLWSFHQDLIPWLALVLVPQ